MATGTSGRQKETVGEATGHVFRFGRGGNGIIVVYLPHKKTKPVGCSPAPLSPPPQKHTSPRRRIQWCSAPFPLQRAHTAPPKRLFRGQHGGVHSLSGAAHGTCCRLSQHLCANRTRNEHRPNAPAKAVLSRPHLYTGYRLLRNSIFLLRSERCGRGGGGGRGGGAGRGGVWG